MVVKSLKNDANSITDLSNKNVMKCSSVEIAEIIEFFKNEVCKKSDVKFSVNFISLDFAHLGDKIELVYTDDDDRTNYSSKDICDFYDTYDNFVCGVQSYNISSIKMIYLLFYIYAILNNTNDDSDMISNCIYIYDKSENDMKLYIHYNDSVIDDFFKTYISDDETYLSFNDVNYDSVFCPEDHVVERISNIVFGPINDVIGDYGEDGRLENVLQSIKFDLEFKDR